MVVVDDPRQAMAEAAAAIYGRPAEAMTMYAVTGTNGKTTTTFLLDAALRAAGVRTGMVGTIGFFLDGQPLAAPRTTVTTPEATELQGLLGYLHEQGAEAALMEVSSHALALGRVDAIVFAVAAFTNLGRDHLDFHLDEEAYFEAKASLFTPERTRRAVVNVDDPRGRQLAERIVRDGKVELTTVGLGGTTDVAALSCDLRDDGRTAVRARLRSRPVAFTLGLPGAFNVRNAITALAMVEATGGDVDAAAAGLADASVPGRMQRVDLGPDAPVVYVDFAHTPQAVTAALEAVGIAAADRRARLRRRPGPGQAAADGRRGRPARRPRGGDRRQPPQRGPGRDPRRGAGRGPGRHRDDRGASMAATAARPSGSRCSGRDRATSSRCSARATSSARRSAGPCSRSATPRWSPPSGPRSEQEGAGDRRCRSPRWPPCWAPT